MVLFSVALLELPNLEHLKIHHLNGLAFQAQDQAKHQMDPKNLDQRQSHHQSHYQSYRHFQGHRHYQSYHHHHCSNHLL